MSSLVKQIQPPVEATSNLHFTLENLAPHMDLLADDYEKAKEVSKMLLELLPEDED